MSVKVRRERPDQRRHHRVTAPLYVTLSGHTQRAADWSLGGLRLTGYPGPLPAVGATLTLHLALPFQGFAISFDATVEVVRIDPVERMLAVRFVDLGDREARIMQHFVEELIRGAMIDVEDTIQRMDVPLTPVSTKPDPNPRSELPIRRWPVKTIAYTAFYAVLGLSIFTYSGLLAYSNFFRMEIESAVIQAPVEAVRAEADGHVTWAEFRPGDFVPQGEIVLNVADNELERQIDFADIEITERKAKLLYLKHRQLNELDRMEDFATVELKNLDQSKFDLEARAEEAKAAAAQATRITKLFKKGYATRLQLDNASKAAVTARKAFQSAEVELSSRRTLAGRDIGERHYTGENFVGERAQIEAEIKLAEAEIMTASGKHQALVAHRTRLAARAPFDALLLDLPRVNDGSVHRGDVIAILEQPRSRRVMAYLTQDEVLKVGLGDEASVFVPSTETTLVARVTGIDRTSGFVDEQNQTYSWRGRKDRTAKVTLEFSDTSPLDDKASYRSGTPVVVIFDARSTNQLLSDIRQKVGRLDDAPPAGAEPPTQLADNAAAAGEPGS